MTIACDLCYSHHYHRPLETWLPDRIRSTLFRPIYNQNTDIGPILPTNQPTRGDRIYTYAAARHRQQLTSPPPPPNTHKPKVRNFLLPEPAAPSIVGFVCPNCGAVNTTTTTRTSVLSCIIIIVVEWHCLPRWRESSMLFTGGAFLLESVAACGA